jgi:hypothetical protein
MIPSINTTAASAHSAKRTSREPFTLAMHRHCDRTLHRYDELNPSSQPAPPNKPKQPPHAAKRAHL